MYLIKLTAVALLLFGSSLNAQIRISGFVRDSVSHEVLVGAHVVEESTNRAAIADNKGYFSFSATGKGKVTISYVGYTSKTLHINFKKDTLIGVILSPGNQIDEVVVSHIRQPPFNVVTLSQLELQSIPSLGAKPDVMKAIQLLPGIQTQNEGSSLILVRGGNPGENLYLLDNTALIYVNHLSGLMSVFNPDMINSIDVYKGGFPAKYGGKLSSIMDISQREGDPTYTKGTLSLGITDVSASIEGPTPIANSSFIITGRKTLTDPLMLLGTSLIDGGKYRVFYGFHDVNGKFTWRPNNHNNFSLNVYHGDDYLGVWQKYNDNSTHKQSSKTNTVWGNWMVSASWNRVHSPRLYSNQTLSYVRYRLNQGSKSTLLSPEDTIAHNLSYVSSVQDVSYKSGLRYELLPNWTINGGVQASLLMHNPNAIKNSSRPNLKSEPTIFSTETAMYLESRLKFLTVLEFQAGVRGVIFANKGYSHFGLEPRINLDIGLNAQNKLNLSYMQAAQYSHMLFTTGEFNNSEVWVPSGADIPQAHTRQIAAGWKGNFINGMINAETNIYYKTLNNLATYQEGYANLAGDGLWRNKVVTGGSGKAFGVELLLRKTHGKWQGFASYAWSKSIRQNSEINNGLEYLFEFDRPHSAAISISHKLTKKTLLTASWVYQTGLPFTPIVGRHYALDIDNSTPEELYTFDAITFGKRNSDRMGNYHRLDLALQYNTHTRNKGYKVQWAFSIYNAYNRQNPYTYLFRNKPEPLENSYEQIGVFQSSIFPIIPSLSYKIFFDKKEKKESKPRDTKPWYKKIFFH